MEGILYLFFVLFVVLFPWLVTKHPGAHIQAEDTCTRSMATNNTAGGLLGKILGHFSPHVTRPAKGKQGCKPGNHCAMSLGEYDGASSTLSVPWMEVYIPRPGASRN